MNTRRIIVPILCLFLLNFTGVVHGTETILDDTVALGPAGANPLYKEYYFDLPAGDTITIYIERIYGWALALDFFIKNETDTLYSKDSIMSLDDVWTVPAEGHYVFHLEADEYCGVHIVLGSEIIPEFPTWTSMLLVLITLTVAIALYKRRLFKTPIH
jgi:hypothetical protein